MNLKTKAAIAVLDAMYSDILSAVGHAVAKLLELGEEHSAMELRKWGSSVARQHRTLPNVLAKVGQELREQGRR